jgi:hypothetical protein
VHWYALSAEQEPGKEGRDRLRGGENVGAGNEIANKLRGLYAEGGVYAATSRYEPFGLSPVEGALSRCALLMNDNPVFHELWVIRQSISKR